MLKFVLLILDGFGLREAVTGNAIKLARTPTLDRLLNGYPMIPLHTSGADVGLPAGVMGNSEVGHMNIGAGRIVMQDLVRVNHSIAQGEFQSNPVLLEQMQAAKARGGDYHVLGLCSDGGVHSHMDHFNAVLKIAKDQGLEQVYFHAMMDGRDTSPWAGADYLQQVQAWMNELGIGTIASVIGRYYAMDRDNRWERIKLAYDMLVHGRGTEHGSAAEAMSASYAGETGDEFVTPRIIGPGRTFKNGDALLSVNYRADRIRQLVRALKLPGSTALDVDPPDIDLCCMTNYSEEFNFPVLFPPVEIFKTMPEILSHAGYRQLRLAETEKYAHVTYFLNGGKEKQYPGEDRSLVQSPKVATYDLKPAMSAEEVTIKAVQAATGGDYDCVMINLANPDMVGHTGVLAAAIEAMEVVDKCVKDISDATLGQGAALFLTADHGNIEMMIDETTGQPHTAHTTLDVPLVLVSENRGLGLTGTGRLADIAPTILDYLGLPQPEEMTGVSRLTTEKQ